MAVTVTSFRIRFPEFDNLVLFPDARVQLFIDDAENDLNRSRFSVYNGDRLVHFLAAHYLQIATNSETGNKGTSGPIASTSVGEVSVSYAISSDAKGSDAYYLSTVYGQQYLAGIRALVPGVLSIA